jgi:hypothetical protein
MILYKKYKNRIFKSIDIKICNEEEPWNIGSSFFYFFSL